MVNPKTISRIKEKNIDTQLLNKLRYGYGYPPKIAESIVDTVKETLNSSLSAATGFGVVSFLATPISAGAGEKLKEIPLKTVHLTVYSEEDPETYHQHGIAALRQAKILRVTDEAYEQGALLTTEDLAILLCSSTRTIEYDLKHLREKGIAIRTRGHVKGIGQRASHRGWIVGLYLEGLEMDDLVLRTKHSEQALSNYLETFKRVVLLTDRNMSLEDISTALGISRPLVGEYQHLIQEHSTSSRLDAIRSIAIPADDNEKGGSR